MTDENPYQSPATVDTADDSDLRKQVRAAVRIPALSLVVLSCLTLLLDVGMAFVSSGSDFEPQLSGVLTLAHIVKPHIKAEFPD